MAAETAVAEVIAEVVADGAAPAADTAKPKRKKAPSVHILKFLGALRTAAKETPRPTPAQMATRLGMTLQSFNQRLYAERSLYSDNEDFRAEFKDQYPLDAEGNIQKFEDGSYKWPDFFNLTDGRKEGNNKKPAGTSSREALRKLMAGETEIVDEV